MSVRPPQLDAAFDIASMLLYDEREETPTSDPKIPQPNTHRVLKRKLVVLDIPAEEFEIDGGFRVPLPPARIKIIEAEIAEKREKLKVQETIKAKEVALRKLLRMQDPLPEEDEPKPIRPPKRIKPVDEMTSQEVRLAYAMVESQAKLSSTPIDSIKSQEAREQFEKLKQQAAKRALRKAALLAKAKKSAQEPLPA